MCDYSVDRHIFSRSLLIDGSLLHGLVGSLAAHKGTEENHREDQAKRSDHDVGDRHKVVLAAE